MNELLGGVCPERRALSRLPPQTLPEVVVVALYPERLMRRFTGAADNRSTEMVECGRRGDAWGDRGGLRTTHRSRSLTIAEVLPKEQARKKSLAQHRLTPELSRAAKRLRLE